MPLTVVYGTRPEVIKLAPVVQELRRRGVQPTIVSTGQHTTLLRGTPAETALVPDVSLGLASENDPLHYASVCEAALRARWCQDRPDLVMVQGDTASAYAAALAANQLRINLAHVEAGIRTGDVDDPWPEEIFRTHIDAVARWKYCATNANYFNTAPDTPPDPGEACGCDHSRVTGNPGIDALYAHTQPTRTVEDCVLITLHRRESFGKPLRQLITGLLKSAERHAALTFAWPLHPNPRVLEAINADVADHYLPPPNLEVMDPLPMVDFAGWLSTSRCVITDSGGVQEEAAALGIPCCVAREKTDRPESVDVGLAKVIGRTAPGVLDGLDWALGFSTRPDPSPCFGDGHAAPRIVDHLLSVSG